MKGRVWEYRNSDYLFYHSHLVRKRESKGIDLTVKLLLGFPFQWCCCWYFWSECWWLVENRTASVGHRCMSLKPTKPSSALFLLCNALLPVSERNRKSLHWEILYLSAIKPPKASILSLLFPSICCTRKIVFFLKASPLSTFSHISDLPCFPPIYSTVLSPLALFTPPLSHALKSCKKTKTKTFLNSTFQRILSLCHFLCNQTLERNMPGFVGGTLS